MFHPHRVNGRTRYKLLFLEKENQASKENTAAASSQPRIASFHQRTSRRPQVAKKKKKKEWIAVNSWSHSFSLCALTSSKTPAPSCEILSYGIYKSPCPIRKEENTLLPHESWRMGGKEVPLRKVGNSILLEFSRIMCKRFP